MIPENEWEEIGKLTEESNRHIPASFCRIIPNIHKDQKLYTAEAYSFWFVHMAPTLLLNRFGSQRYYRHAMLLVKIIEKCLSFEMTRDEIDALEDDIRTWVTKFER